MRIPCITTPLANSSLNATDGVQVLLGSDATRLAEAVVRILDDETLATTLSDNAFDFVHSNFSWSVAGAGLEAILHRAIDIHNADEKVELEDE